MRPLLLLLALVTASFPSFASDSDASALPTVVKGEHYTITSFAGAEQAKSTLNLMEALLVSYNRLFLFDLSKLPASLNVTIYATKADFSQALQGRVNPVPQDDVFLQYTDPTQSSLVCWADPDIRPLAFQGFYQYLWSFIPRTPSWIETGLAYHFWNVTWSDHGLEFPVDHPFLDALMARWTTTPLSDLSGLLTAVTANELDSWALVTFLLESSDPQYARLMGSILGNLAPAASLESNRQGALQRFQSAQSLTQAAGDLTAWWKSQTSLSTLLNQGVAKLKEKNPTEAQKLFQLALAQRPSDEQAHYYCGLAAYELKDYVRAEEQFALINGKTLPDGLLAYAKGLTAFSQKKWDEAKTLLAKAVAENETEYKKLVQPVLDLIK